jgi:anti-anti-sigma factor
MEIMVSHQQGRVPVTIFHIKGDLNTETYEQFQAQAQQALQAGTRYLLLDLSEVPYVSSYGIRGISQVFTWLRDTRQGESEADVSQGLRDGSFKSPHLKLFNPSRRVLQVLTKAGIDMFLEVHSDLQEAVASF